MANVMQTFCKKLYDTKQGTDLIITFNSIPYHVHSLVLGMTSKYFEDLVLSKENGESMDFELDISYISQDAFEHFLRFSYSEELDMNYALPMLSLSAHFECDKLWEACQRYRLYNVPFCENNALHFFQYIISKFTLDETKEVINDKLLVDCVVWFTLHFDKILELKLETLKLIPLEWLRYVFGKAVFHVFESELDRLQKARQLYFKLGESKELFSALFEGIRFNCITFPEMCDERLLFLYQSDNDIVIDKLQSPRISDMSGMYNQDFLAENRSLVMKVDSNDCGDCQVTTRYSMGTNVRGTLRYIETEELSHELEFEVALWPRQDSQRSSSKLSLILCAIQQDFGKWDIYYKDWSLNTYSRSMTLFSTDIPHMSPDMLFRISVLSLYIDYWR
jgi:hypothetical protein